MLKPNPQCEGICRWSWSSPLKEKGYYLNWLGAYRINKKTFILAHPIGICMHVQILALKIPNYVRLGKSLERSKPQILIWKLGES